MQLPNTQLQPKQSTWIRAEFLVVVHQRLSEIFDSPVLDLWPIKCLCQVNHWLTSDYHSE